MRAIDKVKELREATGISVMACKRALDEAGGDISRALSALKEMEAVLASKKAERETTEGLVAAYVSEDSTIGSLLELDCESDFVASNAGFIEFASTLARHVAHSVAADPQGLLAEELTGGNATVGESITSLISRFGENIRLAGFERLTTREGAIGAYMHNTGRLGALVEVAYSGDKEAAIIASREIAMQVAAADPLYADVGDVDAGLLREQERSFREEAASQDKPVSVIDKIVAGKMERFLRERCLSRQPWIKDEKKTIAELIGELAGGSGRMRIVAFERAEIRGGECPLAP